MDIESGKIDSQSNNGRFLESGFEWFKGFIGKLIQSGTKFEGKVEKLGRDDPRRLIHSLKVGITLALVAILFYFSPIYGGFKSATMCAILTVVVVFEFSVGATLGKGMNRAIATFAGAGLGVAIHHLADLAGKGGEPILLGSFVFLLAAVGSFSRFFPGIKARYDYGVLTFILTFSLVSVSGYRIDEIFELVLHRFSTVLIGCLICVMISVFVYPVWAGEDLHNQTCLNMEKLGDLLEAIGRDV
ncbi:aluminum-activated malate transporter 2-like [Papaver somniferum]|uniref:aluminum-activated malate transporter 2-like n=1 Tax=Papaver somniferum TaxID=3469 RepID=UPI000E704169|nr:aluminum-activated malate transporter 2-like [Papaver somniferum]